MTDETAESLPPYGDEVDQKLLFLVKAAAIEGKRFSWKFIKVLLMSVLRQESMELQAKCYADPKMACGKSLALEFCTRHKLNPALGNNPKPGFIFPFDDWPLSWKQSANVEGDECPTPTLPTDHLLSTDCHHPSEPFCHQSSDQNDHTQLDHQSGTCEPAQSSDPIQFINPTSSANKEDAVSSITMSSLSLLDPVGSSASFHPDHTSVSSSDHQPVFRQTKQQVRSRAWDEYTVSSGSFSSDGDDGSRSLDKVKLPAVVPSIVALPAAQIPAKRNIKKRRRTGAASNRKKKVVKKEVYDSFIDRKPVTPAASAAKSALKNDYERIALLQVSFDPYSFASAHNPGVRELTARGPYNVITLFTFKGSTHTPTAAKRHVHTFVKMLEFAPPDKDYSLVNVPGKGSCVLHSLIAGMRAASIPFPDDALGDVVKLRAAVVAYMINNPMAVHCGKTLLGHFLLDVNGEHKELFENHNDVPEDAASSAPWFLQMLITYGDHCHLLKQTTTFIETCPLVVATLLLGVNCNLLTLGSEVTAYEVYFDHAKDHTVRLVLNCMSEHCLAQVDNEDLRKLGETH